MRALFTSEEIKQLHNKFRAARQENERAQKVFDSVDSKGHRVGKNEQKQKLLASWLKDPEMKKGFWEVAQTMEFSEGIQRTSKWKTQKQMEEKYTPSEIEEMIDSKSIQVPESDSSNVIRIVHTVNYLCVHMSPCADV
eukprot:4612797-Pyramimonas_sp.AAC.1